jgi:hypothetical protein
VIQQRSKRENCLTNTFISNVAICFKRTAQRVIIRYTKHRILENEFTEHGLLFFVENRTEFRAIQQQIDQNCGCAALNEIAIFRYSPIVEAQRIDRVKQSLLLLKIVHFREIKVQDSGVLIFDGLKVFLQSSWIVIENAERFQKCAQANRIIVFE